MTGPKADHGKRVALCLGFSALLILLLAACLPAAASREEGALEGPTGIAGSVTDRQGLPAAGAFVYAYRSARGGLRGPADFEVLVNGEGRYFLDLVPGSYHLVARWRGGGADAGPPRPGDAWALPKRNPVAVREGSTTRADFLLQGVVRPTLMREGTLTAGDTGFTGRLVDGEGKGVAGGFVLAYRDLDTHRMPDATSPAAGEDGRFLLYLPQGGNWCLAARTRTRGQPTAGEPYGLLGPGAGGCRQVKKGEVRDVGEIVLRPYRR